MLGLATSTADAWTVQGSGPQSGVAAPGGGKVAALAQERAAAPYGRLPHALHRELLSMPVPTTHLRRAPSAIHVCKHAGPELESPQRVCKPHERSQSCRGVAIEITCAESAWSGRQDQQVQATTANRASHEQADSKFAEVQSRDDADIGPTATSPCHTAAGSATLTGTGGGAVCCAESPQIVAPSVQDSDAEELAEQDAGETMHEAASAETPRILDAQRGHSYFEASMAAAAHEQREQARNIVERVAMVRLCTSQRRPKLNSLLLGNLTPLCLG